MEINSSLDLQSSSIREDPSKLVVYPYSLPGHPAYAIHGVPSRRSLAAAPNSVGEILTGMSDNDKNKLEFIGARLDFIMTVTYVYIEWNFYFFSFPLYRPGLTMISNDVL